MGFHLIMFFYNLFVGNSKLFHIQEPSGPVVPIVLPIKTFGGIINHGFEIVNAVAGGDITTAGGSIIACVLVLHCLLGIGEIVNGQQTRFKQMDFWLRILFTTLLVVGFSKVFIGGVAPVTIKNSFGKVVGGWVEMNKIYMEHILEPKLKKIKEDDEITKTGHVLMETTPLELSGNIATKPISVQSLKDEVIPWFLNIGSIVTGYVAMLAVLLKAFSAIVQSFCILVMGPFCLAFAVHQNTQEIAIGYFKSFLVYVVFYMPMLLFAMDIGLYFSISLVNSDVVNQLMNSVGISDVGITGILNSFVTLALIPMITLGAINAVPGIVKGLLR